MAVSSDDGDAGAASGEVVLTVAPDQAGERLDKALADAATVPGLSRSRLARLIAAGAVQDPDGRTVEDHRAKVKPGAWRVRLPPPAPARPEAQAIALDIVHEDAAIVVVNKPAGMVVHPAPGAERGTLVNALLHHCGAGLTGIGEEARPGIVHRIDKDTTGLLVVAKTQAAHAALAGQFAARTIERRYLALLWGAPDMADPRLAGLPGISAEAGGVLRIDAPLARHRTDRKRMAVAAGGRRAVTRVRVLERFGTGRPLACLAECRLETGRTHQIRAHLAHVGFPLIGDRTYGRARSLPEGVPEDLRAHLRRFPRQALHAASLGLSHPGTGEWLSWESPPPDDIDALLRDLRRIGSPAR
ncbi:MAG TPA: RluA family pseudouridine synthase [Thermohalobaculum sp.]|nr:RluA family pseudouridine synthase [Thermohalobaculum sp.]